MKDGLNVHCRLTFRHSAGHRLADAFLLFVALGSLLIWPSLLIADQNIQPQGIPNILSQRGKDLSALKAVMAITTVYDRGQTRQELRGFLLYRRPADFRFQGIGPGGNSLLELVIKSEKFELYVPADGKILKGDKQCFFRRFPDVGELDSLIPLALLQWKTAQVGGVVSSDPEKTVIRLNFNGSNWKVTLDTKELLLKRIERLGSTSAALTADFADFKTGDYGWLPRRFDVRSPGGGWRTLVKIDKIEVNPFLVEKNFKLEANFSPKIEDCR